MEKINGYTAEEAESLVNYIAEGKKSGKTLSDLFETYGKAHGRAGGSVRNYYYQLLKSDDARAKALVRGRKLRAGKIREFTKEETDDMLEKIFTERGKGFSVRRSIANVCGKDEKLMLRYQNKYRNMLKKQPDEIRAVAAKMGMEDFVSARRRDADSFLQKRLEREINELYDRLALNLREENDRLKKTVQKLTEENELLRRMGGGKHGEADCG